MTLDPEKIESRVLTKITSSMNAPALLWIGARMVPSGIFQCPCSTDTMCLARLVTPPWVEIGSIAISSLTYAVGAKQRGFVLEPKSARSPNLVDFSVYSGLQ